jgi:hypothetical protein
MVLHRPRLERETLVAFDSVGSESRGLEVSRAFIHGSVDSCEFRRQGQSGCMERRPTKFQASNIEMVFPIFSAFRNTAGFLCAQIAARSSGDFPPFIFTCDHCTTFPYPANQHIPHKRGSAREHAAAATVAVIPVQGKCHEQALVKEVRAAAG